MIVPPSFMNRQPQFTFVSPPKVVIRLFQASASLDQVGILFSVNPFPQNFFPMSAFLPIPFSVGLYRSKCKCVECSSFFFRFIALLSFLFFAFDSFHQFFHPVGPPVVISLIPLSYSLNPLVFFLSYFPFFPEWAVRLLASTAECPLFLPYFTP